MIDMRYKPYFLPQVHAPIDSVLNGLSDENMAYSFIDIDPNELSTAQGIVFSDEVGNIKLSDNNPIWVSDDMKIIDGHHRWVKSLIDGKNIKCIKISALFNDCCRILNKIQDIYEYCESQKMEEVVVQDVINDNNDTDEEFDFLKALDEDNSMINNDKPSINQQVVIAYRDKPINETSSIGNFFTLEPQDNYSKYEIEFDNLLDTNLFGITFKDGQSPIDILSKNWFPNINFEEISKSYNIPVDNLKNKAIVEKAIKMGYDGIKYGDKIIQGLK